MEFKYLSANMTEEEAKRAYRSLAKEMHPDVGGSEEDFKILAREYAAIQKQVSEAPIADIGDMMMAAGAQVGVIAKTLAELYPRTRVVLNYTLSAIEAEITGNVPMERMLLIERIINSFGYPFTTTLLFKRGERKSWIKLRTVGDVTMINTDVGVDVEVGDEPAYKGRRYTLYKGAKFETCYDKNTDHTYCMRRMPKYSLRDLMGF